MTDVSAPISLLDLAVGVMLAVQGLVVGVVLFRRRARRDRGEGR